MMTTMKRTKTIKPLVQGLALLLALAPLLLTGTAPLASPAEGPPGALAAEPAPVLALADAELRRAMASLQGRPDAPYYLSYTITDTHTARVSAGHGAVQRAQEGRSRVADIDVRVGEPALDNTHKLRDAAWGGDGGRAQLSLPLDGDPYATRLALWRATDEAWRAARRRYTQVVANEQVKVEREDSSPDFSPAEPARELRTSQPLRVDLAAWEPLAREVSRVLADHPHIYDSRVELLAERRVSHLATSEGTLIQHSTVRYRAALWAVTVAEDGMELEVYDHQDAASLEGLPDREALLARARAVVERVAALREAPVLDPYTGPAILRGRAAGVFFHEVFGHRIEGHRQRDEDEGQTFTDKVGRPILPEFLSVYDDPSLARRAGVDLNGHYAYDEEGVRAQRVDLVVAGVLRNFLLSRQPIQGFERSNGHGRREPGNAVVARQGNLIVEASRTVPYTELRARLLAEIRAQGQPFGLVVDDITGGFTLTGRVVPNSFNVRPVSLWRVWADGRPDELVRGGDLIGTPLTTFSTILAAADDVEVFNGMCGAESGWVPVSASSPSLLLQQVEVQRKEKSNDRPPLLPHPTEVR